MTYRPGPIPTTTPRSQTLSGRRPPSRGPRNRPIHTGHLGQLDDGADDVTYGREPCGEPNQVINKAGWIDELCEAGYWQQTHWDCTGVTARSLTPGNGFRLRESEPAFGGRLSGTVDLVNALDQREFGSLVVELVTSRPESKAFAECPWP